MNALNEATGREANKAVNIGLKCLNNRHKEMTEPRSGPHF